MAALGGGGDMTGGGDDLVESMVVLSLGSRIRAKDIPEQIYRRGSPERLLPVLNRDAQAGEDWNRRQEAMERQLLYKAVDDAVREFMSAGKFPAGAFFLELPPEEINPSTHVLGNRPRYRGIVEKCTFCIQRTRAGLYPLYPHSRTVEETCPW